MSESLLLTLAAASSSEPDAARSLKNLVGPILETVSLVVGVVAVLVMLYGVARAVVAFAQSERKSGAEHQRSELRAGLAYFILLGLELLIVADIIETIVAPDFDHVLTLGVIVVIRTVISFSLNWELANEARRLSGEHSAVAGERRAEQAVPPGR